MARIIFTLFMVCFCLYPVPGLAAPETVTPEGQVAELEMNKLEEFVEHLNQEVEGAIPHFGFQEMVSQLIKGDFSWQLSDILTGLLKYLFKEVVANASLLGKLVVLAVICAVLQNLMSAFDRGTTGKLAYAVSYMVLVSLAVGSFALALNIGREAVDNMVHFMQALLPLLLTLLAAMGGVASTAIFHPIIFGAIAAIGTVVKVIIFPLIFFSAVLTILSNLSERFQVSRLADLMKTVGMAVMGLCSTVFLGLLALKGVAGSVTDGIAIRTAKFATDAFIPVVGGMFSDALDAVIGSSLLIKNAVGIAGVVVIFTLTILPMLKIFAVAFVYKLAGALIQPVGDKQMADCLTALGNSLLGIFAAVAMVGLLFFFAITIVVGMGDLMTMLR
ncbi:stage III sporulation protein AE [Desulforamulus ruminis]|uniref:Stage III sporulation protein AE n=1 Tax=Desulforamulus ruminis (strain ATCC 23193 / DSM 2154 / NCIMB 8452 / DL) TaxID=696281 RepID=F6DUB2_DESRL|nr:stage III sporulation protein AE [Desulforamulus ruminis]AEG61297.1 stage III sporulation protein AE [Desulforamulus ruminis DSM 2154]